MRRFRTPIVASVATLLVAVLTGTLVSGAGAEGGFRYASSYDDDIERAKDKSADYESQLEDLEAALEDTSKEIVEASRKLERTEAKLPAAQKALDAANEKVDEAILQQKLTADKLEAAEAQDKAISQQIAEDEDRIGELEQIIAALARAQYQGVGDDEALSLVFGASTSQEFIDEFAAEHNASRVQSNALADVEEIAAVNRNRGARQEAVRDYIVELKAEADALVIETERLQKKAEEKKAALDALIAEQQEIKADLEKKKAQELERQQEIAAKQDAIRNQIKNLVKKKLAEEEAARKAAEEAARKAAEEAAKAQNNSGGSSGSGGSSSSGGSGGSSSSGGSLTKGILAWPSPYHVVTSSYGMRYHPILHYWRLHAGTDIRAYCGTPIYAARAGRVQWATYQYGLGNSVLVDHGYLGGKSLMTSYNHLSSFAVSSGQYVTKGQLVGYSGNTGTSAACHLHFEVYVNGDTTDPMQYIG